jgi:hypothetical protein
MIHSETKITKLKSEAFQIMESLDTSIYIDLFSKTIISIMGDKHHSHPVISGVTRNLFRVTATYNIHNVFFPVAPFIGHTFSGVPHATKNRLYHCWRKRWLFICGSYNILF